MTLAKPNKVYSVHFTRFMRSETQIKLSDFAMFECHKVSRLANPMSPLRPLLEATCNPMIVQLAIISANQSPQDLIQSHQHHIIYPSPFQHNSSFNTLYSCQNNSNGSHSTVISISSFNIICPEEMTFNIHCI